MALGSQLGGSPRGAALVALALSLGCGGGAPPARSAERTENAPPRAVAVLAARDPAPEPDAALAPPPEADPLRALPTDRTEAPPLPFPSELRPIEARHAAACAMPIGSTVPAATLEDEARDLAGQIESAVIALRTLDEAYEAAASTPALRAHASMRQGDAYDSLAARMAAVDLPLPLDVEARIRRATPEVQDEVRVQVRDRVRETMAQQARNVWCMAVMHYQDAAAGPDVPAAARAREQLAGYGAAFVASCGF